MTEDEKTIVASPDLTKALRTLFLTVFRLDTMSWMEKLMAVNHIVQSVSEILGEIKGLTKTQAAELIANGIDPLLGDDPQAIFGTAPQAIIRIDPGIFGDEGLELLTDLVTRVSANAIASAIKD